MQTERDYDELLERGNAAQLEKLRENEHKEGWGNIGISGLYRFMMYEIDELSEEVIDFRVNWSSIPNGDRPDPATKSLLINGLERIRREAADVANFAYFIISKCDEMIRAWSDEAD